MPRIGEDEVMIIGNCRSDKLAALGECGVESCVAIVVGFYSKNTEKTLRSKQPAVINIMIEFVQCPFPLKY